MIVYTVYVCVFARVRVWECACVRACLCARVCVCECVSKTVLILRIIQADIVHKALCNVHVTFVGF